MTTPRHQHVHGPARVEARDGCTLVFGTLADSQARELSRMGSASDVMSSDLARLTGATYAYGPRMDVQQLIDRIRLEKLSVPRPAELRGLNLRAQDWAVAGEVDLSSATIFAWMTGIKLDIHRELPGPKMPTDHPCDPDNFRHCRLLLEWVPSFADRFPDVMNRVSPTWASLVEHWSQICNTLDLESPNWRSSQASSICNDTYRLLKLVVCEDFG